MGTDIFMQLPSSSAQSSLGSFRTSESLRGVAIQQQKNIPIQIKTSSYGSSNTLLLSRKVNDARLLKSIDVSSKLVRKEKRQRDYEVVRQVPQSSSHSVNLTAKVTVRRKRHLNLVEKASEQYDAFMDSACGRKILLQLVSVDVDPGTGLEKRSAVSPLEEWAEKAEIEADKVVYLAHFTISSDFSTPGAIVVINSHANEFYIETISVEGWPCGPVYFPCYSWVHSKMHNPAERTFFSNQSFLPSQTPKGLIHLREKDMAALRGSQEQNSFRNPWERVYDYDTYNDIGNPDKDQSLQRSTIGGSKQFPYPRRCRTGRSPTKTDPKAESVLPMGTNYYVPRDEVFGQIKQQNFIMNTLKGMVHQFVPCLLNNNLGNADAEFHCFSQIDGLYSNTSFCDEKDSSGMDFTSPYQIIRQVQESKTAIENALKYARPDIVANDKFAWLRDDEFGRELLAGSNPVKVERMTSFPPVSQLQSEIFGPPESAITAEHLEGQLNGISVEEALQDGKLFMLDYHDIFMPFVNKINALKDRKMYASRAIFFLTSIGTLMPIAIEMSLPPAGPNCSGSKHVYTPQSDASGFWLWQLAKAHVASNDAGFHQLYSHWVRGHATVEPYIIATHRNLSSMHPIYKLLQPHFRYTLEINASARQLLINAGGVIESCFTPGPYSMEISSAAYDALWRFDRESLPADLLARGMAVENPSKPEGIELVIEDYPYAADGLLIWSAIRSWVNEYVALYYSDPESVVQDEEIQNWWREIREVGHADKANEPWWPELRSKEDLQSILTTMIWVVSGYHAAVNFGQYAYGAYVPNRPCMTRRLIPEEGEPEYLELMKNPEKFFLSTIPNQQQATTTMAVLDTLSTHSPDEEYLGQRLHTNWTRDAAALEASLRFQSSIQAIEQEIQKRNSETSLKNRNGAGILAYELLIPSSTPGRTGRGVPNSISI